MKLKMKLVAVAAALASLAGVAHADLTAPGVNNGSFALVAFNTVTRDWYIRDLGYLMNGFLPSGITTSVADGSAVGDKSPDTGLVIAGSLAAAAAALPGNTAPVEVQANFSDAAFATWFSAQPAADVRWMVGSYDFVSQSSTGSQRRLIMSSKDPAESFTNGNLDSFTASGNFGGLSSLFGTGTLSKTGSALAGQADTGFNGGLTLDTLGMVGDSQSLFYAVRSTFTGSSGNTPSPLSNFGGATITLEADGDLIYSTPAAVPLPPALWMMGAGLVAIGGMVRRRRAAALQA